MKNTWDVGGKPPNAWTIEEDRKSKCINLLILSSNDGEIIWVAREWACDVPFVRPNQLAQDDTPGVELILHALRVLPGYGYVTMLQPTSPLRSADDIDGCIERCVKTNFKACVSVADVEKHPFWMYRLDRQGEMFPLIETDQQYLRRQDLSKIYPLNGAVYVAECSWLFETRNLLSK